MTVNFSEIGLVSQRFPFKEALACVKSRRERGGILMNRWEKLLIVAGAVVCALVIGAAVYNAYAVTTFEQAMGLPEDKIVKVSIVWTAGPPDGVETTDKTKIHAVLAQLNSQKFRLYPFPVPVISGFNYSIQIYSSNDSWKRYTLAVGHGGFGYWGDFAGSKLQGYWYAENYNAVYHILANFYVAWGG